MVHAEQGVQQNMAACLPWCTTARCRVRVHVHAGPGVLLSYCLLLSVVKMDCHRHQYNNIAMPGYPSINFIVIMSQGPREISVKRTTTNHLNSR